MAWSKVHMNNLAHVLEDSCKDPDCEIHNPWVGFEEQTVSPTDLAFFLAGVQALRDRVKDDYDSMAESITDLIPVQGNGDNDVDP